MFTNSGRTYQYLAVASGSLNIMASGMHYGWPSTTIPKLLQNDSRIKMTEEESSWIVVITFFGTFCGAILASKLVDRYGRKSTIMFTSIPFIVSWLMIAFADSVPTLIIARFTAGLADGTVYSTFTIYIGEIADPKIRGLFGSWISVVMILGTLLTNIMGFYLSYLATALISLIVPIMLLLTFSWMPESPYYLLMKGKDQSAKKALQTFRGTTEVEQELNRLSKCIEEQNTNTARYLDLFRNSTNRKALLIVMGVLATQQFTGVTAITFYANTIFRASGSSVEPIVASSTYFAIQILLVVVASVIVDRCGRRPLLIVSVIGSGLSLLVESCYFYVLNRTDLDESDFSWVPVAALIGFIILFSIGMQPVPVLLVSEVFPTNVKAHAVSFTSNYYAIITMLASKFFQITMNEFGMHVPFLVFSVCCVLGFLHIFLYVPETKGKTLEDIQEELKK